MQLCLLNAISFDEDPVIRLRFSIAKVRLNLSLYHITSIHRIQVLDYKMYLTVVLHLYSPIYRPKSRDIYHVSLTLPLPALRYRNRIAESQQRAVWWQDSLTSSLRCQPCLYILVVDVILYNFTTLHITLDTNWLKIVELAKLTNRLFFSSLGVIFQGL